MLERAHILVCGGTGCTSNHSVEIIEALHKELEKQGLAQEVKVVKTGCFGLCAQGPIMIVYPEGAFYAQVKVSDVAEIVSEHLLKGRIVKRLVYSETATAEHIKALSETNFYAKQHRIVLRNCGVIDPENIDEYLATDGYKAYEKAVTTMTPQEVIDVISKSGLRGRGGAGFPTGKKWQFCRDAAGAQKYVCCNADEGDPGAFMDRSVLEGDPHAVIEAMMLAGYATGATQGYVYIRAEYPIAVARLKIAIDQAREYGLLGKNILGMGIDFDLDLRLGAGAFVCGEETALLNSVEGKRGEPRVRPPFPAIKGLYGMPTLLNNVETYANIAQIVLKGADWFRSIGTEKSPGTKVFALGGNVVNTGLVEVPMGTSLREIVFDIGGGIPKGRKFKAAQTGGPSGGCIPANLLDTPIDYDSLIAVGSMMGSGGLIVMDDSNCMVDIAKFFLKFTVDESCGKCVPCRIGNKRLLEILDKITDGKAVMEDLDKLEELSNHIKATSLCGLGQTAPNPVIATLRYFRDEYVAHVKDKKCPAGVCKKLITYKVNPDKCVGCTLCKRNCPVDAIKGELKQKHVIDADKCIKCGLCIDNCKLRAIDKV